MNVDMHEVGDRMGGRVVRRNELPADVVEHLRLMLRVGDASGLNEALLALYNDRWSMPTLGAALGMSKQAVQQRIAKAWGEGGDEPRPGSGTSGGVELPDELIERHPFL